MKGLLKYLGVTLIVVGIILFVIDYFFKCNSNALLLTGLGFVLIGVLGQIKSMKKEGEA